MFKKIMVPVDLTHADHLSRSIDVAASLAKTYSCSVCFVGVTTSQPSSVAHNPAEYAAKLAAFAAARGTEGGIETESRSMVSHDPSVDLNHTLLKAAEAIGADLIVMASHIPNLADHLWPSHGGKIAARFHGSVFVIR